MLSSILLSLFLFSGCETQAEKCSKRKVDITAQQDKLDAELHGIKEEYLNNDVALQSILTIIQTTGGEAAAQLQSKLIQELSQTNPEEVQKNKSEQFLTEIVINMPGVLWKVIEQPLREYVTNDLMDFQKKCISTKSLSDKSGHSYLDDIKNESFKKRCVAVNKMQYEIKVLEKERKQEGCTK